MGREARTLTDAGYQVTVISPSQPGRPWCETIDGVRVYRYPAPPEASGFVGYLLEYGMSMVGMLILSLVVYFCEGFDVIYAANPPDTLVFVAAAYPHIAPLMCTSAEEIVAMAEVVVITNGTAAFCRVPGLLRADQILIDVVGLTTGYSAAHDELGRKLAGR